jgi:hypothetical protein
MSEKKIRDAAYYEARIKAEFPAIYRQLKAGKIPSVRQAAAKAGLITLPSRQLSLKRLYAGSTPAVQRAFLLWAQRPTPRSA